MILKNRVQRFLGILLISTVLMILSLSFVFAAAGNSCNETTTPCACGSACQNGGYETGNGYNTIDSCADGTQDNYEYVHDITITNMDDSTYSAGDTVEIDAHFDCDLDEDSVSIAYNNDSSSDNWVNVYDNSCGVDGKAHFYKNITLDNVEGTHAVRAIIALNGEPGMTCGKDHEPTYTDTDDIEFDVLGVLSDNENPSVTDIIPTNSQEYFGSSVVVNISANISDNIGIENVTANITWGSKSEIVNLTNASGNIFSGNFTNTSNIASYNLTIFAYDTSGNVNNSESVIFSINDTTNVTITYPIEENMYPSKNVYVEYEIGYGPAETSSWIRLNDETNVFGDNQKTAFETEDSPQDYESHNVYGNISQSFMPTRNTYVSNISIKIKRNGSPSNNTRVEIRNDASGNPSDTILAYSNITSNMVSNSSDWVNLTLNETILLSANTTYWLYLKPNGSSTDYYDWEANTNNVYSLGNYSNNITKDLLFRIEDKYRFNATFTPEEDMYSIQAYASTDQGQIISSIISVEYDLEGPEYADIDTIPESNEINRLDPNFVINVTADTSDNLEIKEVILQYMLQNDTEWTNKTMELDTPPFYVANLSISSESNVTVQLLSRDTSDLETFSDTIVLPIFYDWNWSVTPTQFNATGVIINNNASIGNLTIISETDFDVDFNISYSSTATVFINGSSENIVYVPANSNATVEINATAAITPREENITITILSNNASSLFNATTSNATLITLIGGEHLYVDIVQYDSSVTQGDHISSLKARISNVGNETAYNVTALWDLPSGWSSRDELNNTYATLSSGGIQIIDFEITADVSDSANLGSQTLSITVNESGGFEATDSRTVTVSAPEGGGSSGGSSPSSSGGSSSGSSGGGGGSTIIVSRPDIGTDLKTIRVPSNQYFNKYFTIYNNDSRKQLKDVQIELEGIFQNFYNITPNFIENISKNGSKRLILEIQLPSYFEEGKKELKLLLKPNNTKEISKDFVMIVFDNRSPVSECLLDSSDIIEKLKIDGIKITDLESKFKKAQIELDNENILLVRSLCEEIKLFYTDYIKQKDEIRDLENRIQDLRTKGYDTGEIEDYIDFVQEVLMEGNLQKSKEFLEQADLLIKTTAQLEKPMNLRFNEFLRINKHFIIGLLIVGPIIFFISAKLIQNSKTENRINSLKKEKEKIMSLIKEYQESYYDEHMIGEDLYNAYIDDYRKRLGEIEIALINLETKKLKLSRDKSKDSEELRKEIISLIQSVQEDYYVRRIIDYDSYIKLEEMYNSTLAEVEQKIMESDKIKKIDVSQRKDLKDVNDVYEKLKIDNVLIKSKQRKNKKDIEQNISDTKEKEFVKIESSIDGTKETDKKVVPDEEAFKFSDGKQLNSIENLYNVLDDLDESEFNTHVHNRGNNFANWIYDVFNEKELAQKIFNCNSKMEIKEVLKKYLKKEGEFNEGKEES